MWADPRGMAIPLPSSDLRFPATPAPPPSRRSTRADRRAIVACGLSLAMLWDGGEAQARQHRSDKKPATATQPAGTPADGAKDTTAPAPAPAAGKDAAPAPAADSGAKPAAPESAAKPTAPPPKGATAAKPGSASAPAASAKPAGADQVPEAPPKELQVSEPRQQAAREHFMRGVDLYSQGNYPNAWLEFSAAYQIVPLIDLLNNLARCEVRMGRPRDALEHFKRFIQARPTDPDAEYIKQEIARLEGELGRKAHEPAPLDQTEQAAPSAPRRVPVYSIFAGATTVAAAVAGAVTLGLVGSRYSDLQGICAKLGCPAEDVGVLERQSYAGYGLLGVAGVGAVVTGLTLYFELRGAKEAGLRQFAGLRFQSPVASFGSSGRF